MSYEVPSRERDERLLRKEIAEQRDLIRFTPTSKQNDTSAIGSGSHDTSTGVIKTSLVLNPETIYESVQISWTAGSGGDFQVGHVFKTDIDTLGAGWRGILLHIVNGDSTAGTGVFEPIWLIQGLTPRPEFDDASTTLINETVGGWTASYTGGSKDMGNIVPYSASLVVDKMEGGNPDINVIHGAKNNGHVITVKPKDGKTLTLSTGGNIDILSNVIIEDNEIAVLQYHEDAGNKWLLLSGGGGGSSGNVKAPVKVATQFNYLNLALVGDNIDGIVVVAGDRILVKNQSNKADNGIYKVDSVIVGVATLTRDVDMPHNSTAYGGTMVYVESGTNEGGSVQILFTNSTTTSDSILVGTDDQDWYTSSGGEVFTWSANHDANFNNLNNLEQVSFVDSANNQRGFIAGQTDAIRIQVSSGDKSISFREDPYTTDALYINRYGLNQGHATGGGGVNLPINPSAGFISIANDEYITWRNSANTNDALLRFNASDQMEFNFNSIPMLKIDQPNSLLDFEQNNLVRVNNINSYTGDHDIGNTDPFHRIFADRFIPVSENYATGTTGELRKNDFATYIDLQASGTFDIRRNGVGKDGLLTDGSDPWFRFSIVGNAPLLELFSDGINDTKISVGAGKIDRGEIYYDEANDYFTIDKLNASSAKGTVIRASGLLGFGVFSDKIAGFKDLDMSLNDITHTVSVQLDDANTGTLRGGLIAVDTTTGGFNGLRLNSVSGNQIRFSELTNDMMILANGGIELFEPTDLNDNSLFFDQAHKFSIFYLSNTLNYIADDLNGSHDFYVDDLVIPKFGITETSIESNQILNMNGHSIFWNVGLTYGIVAGASTGGFDFTMPSIINGGYDFYIGGGLPKFGITETSVECNAPLDMNLNAIEFQGIIAPSTITNEPQLFADIGNSNHLTIRSGDGSLYDLENLGGGSTSFIGFTADADLNMGTFDISGVDRFTFATTEGAGDFLGPQDTGIDAIYASGTPFGMRINVPSNNFAVLQIARGGIDKYTLSSLGHTFDDVVRFGSNYTVFNSRSAVSHTTPSQRYLFQDSSDNHLKIRTDSGLIDLEGGGGGGHRAYEENNNYWHTLTVTNADVAIDQMSPAPDTVYYILYVPNKDITITELGIMVSTVQTGGTIYFGIYSADSQLRPANRLVNESVNVSSTGFKQNSTFTVTLTANTPYFFALKADHQADLQPQLASHVGWLCTQMPMEFSKVSVNGDFQSDYGWTESYTTFPGIPFTVTTGNLSRLNNFTRCPALMFKCE